MSYFEVPIFNCIIYALLMKNPFWKFGYVKYVNTAVKSIILHVRFRLQ
jgi:hypothetical protein